MTDRRFTALRVIGTIFKILAWTSLIFGLLAAVAVLILSLVLGAEQGPLGLDLGGPLAGIAVFVVTAISTVIGFLTLYAIGESVYLFLSIEENTRRSAYIAQQQYTAYPVSYTPAPPPQPQPEDND
jgi:hypothetical protein